MQNKRKMPRHVNMVNVAEHLETDKRSISQNIRLSLKEFFNFRPLTEREIIGLETIAIFIFFAVATYGLTAFNDYLYWKGL